MRFVVTMTDRGLISLPIKVRKMLGLKAADQLIGETTADGLLLRPCVTLPIEIYSEERLREFDEAEAELGAALKKKGLA